MEEEITYATVVFKNGPQRRNDPTIQSTAKGKQSATTAPGGQSAARSQQLYLLLVFLGVLCILLVATISIILYISLRQKAQDVDLSDQLLNLTATNRQLSAEMSALANRTAELVRDRDDLRRSLAYILSHSSFPVSDFCPDNNCQPCRQGWLLFGGSCYFFDERDPPWQTWDQSRWFCQNHLSDLVIIESLQEQIFINGHIGYYYTTNHGYWCGLRWNEDGGWVWPDGRNDTVGNWLKGQDLGQTRQCVLIIHQDGSNKTNNWVTSDCRQQSKFICEHDALKVVSAG